eukprot:m.136161 g.136161  ORF g.136161 m.136161 type:complete len:327 (+) comp16967_c1_seq6:126-1106(+)
MRITVEDVVVPHDATLYRNDGPAEGSPTLDSHTTWADALTAEATGAYNRTGCMVVRGGLDPDAVAAVLAELDKLVTADQEILEKRVGMISFEGNVCKAQAAGRSALGCDEELDDEQVGPVRYGRRVGSLDAVLPATHRARYIRKLGGFVDREGNTALSAVARHPQLTALLTKLLQGSPRLFQDVALIKPPGGREKPWHQDHAYFKLAEAEKIVGVWIALVATDGGNGCMHVAPGGHAQGPLPHWMRRDWQLCDTDATCFQQVAVEMSPGDVLLFDGKLPHGTPTNYSSDRQRFALQYHFVPEEAELLPDDTERLRLFGSEGSKAEC